MIGTSYSQQRAVWMKSLKVGDKVLVRHDHKGKDSIGNVAKVTPSGMIRLEDGDLYNQDGQLHARATYGWRSLHPLTPEYYEELARRELAHALDRFAFGALSLNKLQRIGAIISE